MMTKSERKLRAEQAAHQSWANTSDRPARMAAARRGFRAKFERQVDPNLELSPAERAKRAESARMAYYKALAYKSAKARRLKREAREAAADRKAS